MSLTTISNQHGQSTQDTQRKQEGSPPEEVWRQVCDREGCKKQGEEPGVGTRARQYLVHLENTAKMTPPFFLSACSAGEIIRFIQDHFSIKHPSLGFFISDSKMGTFGRKYYQDTLPEDSKEIYVTLYLRKHTGFEPM